MSANDSEQGLFNIAIATIFAREILEGALIIGNYRTCILKTVTDDDRRKQQLRAVTIAALVASVVAVIVILAVAIPLGILSNELEKTTVYIIEGVAKVVGAVCILQLSLKMPVWLDIYKKIPIIPWKKHVSLWCNGSYEEKKTKDVGVTSREIFFNVSWNIWREVAECGAFLIPFFLQGTVQAIPISALVGTVISVILGLLIYIANNKLKNKIYLAVLMSGLMLQLSTGLFTMGCHEFEVVWGSTAVVYKIEGEFWNDKSLPMTILRPFGYSSTRTVLQICCFWIWLAFGLFLHYLKYRNTKIARAREEEEEARTENSGELPSTNDNRPSDEVVVGGDEEAPLEGEEDDGPRPR